MREAVAEHGGAVLSGAPGVGKTRLARGVAQDMADWYVARTTVTPAVGDLPLGGIAGLGLIAGKSMLEGPGLLSRLTARLAEAAGGRRTLVVVDDAHLLDDMSAAFIHQLVVSGAAAVLATVRSGEALPPGVLSLSKDALVPRLELQPLGPAEFADLLTAVLGGEAEPETRQRLWSVTAGSVLFLRILLADALEAGTLCRAGDRWRWVPNAVGPRLAELLAERLGRPEGQRRSLIEFLAVGEPLGADLLGQLVPEVNLAEEERRGLIVVEEKRRRAEVRLAHPLFSEVVRAQLPVLARRSLQRRLAEALEAAGSRRQGDLLRLAVLWVESASAADATLLMQAARQARQVFDPALAVRLARASVEVAPSFEAGLVLGGALADKGCFAEAAEVLDGLAGAEPDGRSRQLLARERAWVAFQGQSGAAAAERLLTEAEAAGEDPVLRMLARAELALLLTYRGRFPEALAIGQQLLVDQDTDDRVRLRSLPAIGGCLVLAGQAGKVLELCHGLETAAGRWRGELPQGPGWIWQMRSNALIVSGRLAEAAEVLNPQLEPGVAPSLTEGELAYARTKLGFLLLLQGRAGSARRQLSAAAAALAAADPNGCRVWCLSLAAEAAALSGHVDEAARLASQAMALRSSGFAIWDGDAARARAWAAAAAGERSRAITELLEAADAQDQHGQPALAIFAYHDAVRLGARRASARLEALAAGLDGPYAAAAALHAAAVRMEDPDRLEAAADAFARLGFCLVAAEIAAQASTAWSAARLMARAAGAAAAMDSYLSRCETVLAPSLPTPASLRGLTPREREIAVLAGQGLPNSEIAQRLVISVRTVESHLYAVYGKLGISDRTGLRLVLHSAGSR